MPGWRELTRPRDAICRRLLQYVKPSFSTTYLPINWCSSLSSENGNIFTLVAEENQIGKAQDIPHLTQIGAPDSLTIRTGRKDQRC